MALLLLFPGGGGGGHGRDGEGGGLFGVGGEHEAFLSVSLGDMVLLAFKGYLLDAAALKLSLGVLVVAVVILVVIVLLLLLVSTDVERLLLMGSWMYLIWLLRNGAAGRIW